MSRLSDGAQILIPRIPMISSDSYFPVPFKRMQFPVLVAYYLTVNHAQGQSLERAGIYLPKSVFSHGHLYVTVSRSGDPNKTFQFVDQSEFQNLVQQGHLHPGKTYTRNGVYHEIFNNN